MRTMFAVLFFACSATAEPITLRISRTYTHVEFTIRKWSVLKQEGSFRDCSGEIVLDADHPARSQVHLAVQLASLDTRNAARDRALLGEDFFDAQHHPMMTFASATIAPGNSKDVFDVTGEITIRGVTRRITVPVKFFGLSSQPGSGTVAGFESDFTLDRTDFGVNGTRWSGGKLQLSKEVQVHLAVGGCIEGDHCIP